MNGTFFSERAIHPGTPCLRSHNRSLDWCFWEPPWRTHTSPDLLGRSESSVEEDNREGAMAIQPTNYLVA